MAIRSIRREAARPGAYKGTGNAAPIYVDSDDNSVKIIPAGADSTTEYGVVAVHPSPTGGDSGKGAQITVAPVTGTAGLRQGAINISLSRASTAPITASWDGNPDTGLKIISRNSADNSSGGATRALDIQARNSGTTQTWVKTVECNARNDSGKTVDSLHGIHIRCENYGTVNDDIVGLDIEMSSENDTSSPTKDAILIRNTDASGMTVVNSVIKLSNTSTNGFGALIDFTGTAVAAGTITSTSGSVPTTWAGRIRIVDAAGNAGWIPYYSTSNE